MNTRKVLLVIAISMVSAITGVYTYSLFFKSNPQIVTITEPQKTVAHFASYSGGQQSNLPDLTFAAEHSVHAVVHVKTMSRGTDYYSGNPLYEFFFGPRGMQQPQPVMGSGSGVIITTDGFIVTNNHVIDNAQEIEVVLNDKRSFSAKLVGTDPTTDIALLKIDEEKLPYLTYGDSDELKVGEWVLAVGNPFNLTSTVTAGIVSAKARSINILANRNQPMGIESFIQTDAAVNPGNSGGALVNQKGQLVGINTAIASRTGSFSGYSFAVPVSIAKKVVADLMEFGEVQRGILGVQISDVNKEVVEKFDLDRIEGIFVLAVTEGGGAEAAGIKAGDVIVSVEGEVINSVPELQERISRRRPGDKVNLLIKRDGEKKPFVVTLRNIQGTTNLIISDDLPRSLGAEIQEVSNEDKRRLQIRTGVQIVKVYNGKLKQAGIKEGYIVTKANRVPVTSVEDFKKVVSGVDEGLFLTGIYPNGRVAYYGINLED